ncbi:lantibiotic dehydratase [Streptomyces sp. CA-210063]|uniref:lantibiotic dehydratase n=1 Tax=Streptomyces sp. CA-210063 TaxID=2801029 RepID=UPI00214B200F|nr:lantibiotic dehydratase [Streptomyces sp. CA-210063]UUU32400.1 lantibiotic dehydratase [Streptomyces sp. CA-210063]
MRQTRLLQRSDALLLRAAVLPLTTQQTRWPTLDDPPDCRRWLADIWARPPFAAAVRAASPQLARAVHHILEDADVQPKRLRKATTAVARYLLRAAGRPTPFGLFAGVTPAESGSAEARVGTGHRAIARPDTLWLDHVRRDLQRRPDVLSRLTLQVNDLATRHGDVLMLPLSGGRIASVPITRPLATVLALATRHPVPCQEITDQLIALGGTADQIARLLTDTLEASFLISDLSAPLTEPDPLGHMLSVLRSHMDHLKPETAGVLDDLAAVCRLLAEHDVADDPAAAQVLRDTAEQRMNGISDRGRVRLSVDLRLDARVRIPTPLLEEAERAAVALLRLTRNVGEKPLWAAYHGLFWERYGAGSLIPLQDAVDLAAGVGLPADFPMSLWPEITSKALPRDELLMARAWQAALTGAREIRLTDADLDELCAHTSRDDEAIAPHVEMAVRVHATSTQALDQGEFTVSVRPAWSTGTLTGRFATALPDSGLDEVYRRLPTLVDGALPAQLSFAPLHPHAENVARIPALLSYVIPVGEHRDPANDLIPLDDLAVMSTSKRLHLVCISRRRVVEPVVLHPLALEKQAPPIARFIALLGRGFATAWTQFDWGPLAAGMPYLPRVRYRKSILSPARWRLADADLPPGPFQPAWQSAMADWARMWKCPQLVELRDDDRTLRLDLSEPLHARLLHSHLRRHGNAELLEAPDEQAFGWIGHAHELTLPLTSTRPPLPHPDLTSAPIVTNRMLPMPGDPQQPWVQAKLFTHPTLMDQILTRGLPGLLGPLGGPNSWFVRYRTAQEEDHLRLRIAAHSPGEHTAVIRAVARWAANLQRESLISRLVFDGYRPEFGRYGTGPALESAEAVFVADSDAARTALTDLPGLDRHVLCALGMIDTARGLLGGEEGVHWLATTPARGQGLLSVTRQTLHHTRTEAVPQRPTRTPRLSAAYEQRRIALTEYRSHLTDEQTGPVLESLLHMHHNRIMGPGREAEAACRHAARQACRSLLAQGAAR